MTAHDFHPTLWERDLALLSLGQEALARSALLHATEVLGCTPYHRASKAAASSDRQTLLRHPEAGNVCLVISVVPSLDDQRARVLRIDFFDPREQVVSSCGEAIRAPKTQWTRKAERRVYVARSASVDALHAMLASVVALS